MSKNSYRYFENRDCEFYPCHALEDMNCLFCFCPLYRLKDCGGRYIITDDGRKDCGGCSLPHLPNGYEYIIEKLKESAER